MIVNIKKRAIHAEFLLLLLLGVIALGGLLQRDAAAADGSSARHWYKVLLEEDESQGYQWAVGAKGKKGNGLIGICIQMSVISPPNPDSPDARQVDNATVCGNLESPSQTVSTSAKLGESGTRFFAALYNPVVRKVTVLLSTGQRKVYRPHLPKIPKNGTGGVPSFRYLATTFNGGACARSISTFDGSGHLVSKQGEPCS